MFFVDPYNELDPAIIHDASATWTSDNRILKAGQFGVETDTRKFKIGDGVTAWNSLGYDKSSRVTSITSSAAPTPNSDTTDQYNVKALATDPTFGAPTGTPSDGQKLLIRIKDNGTARTLAYNAIYRAIGITLPTTTTISKTTYLLVVYNSADTKWDVLAVGTEA